MNILNIDKIIISLFPIIFIINSFLFNHKLFLYTTSLMIFIIFYELIIYNKKEVFGFSGINLMSFPSIILVTFTIFISIPSIYICYLYNFNQYTTPYFISILFFYIFYPLGLQFGIKIKNIELNKLINMKYEKIDDSNLFKINYELLVILLSICIFIIANYLMKVNEIPLFELIKNPGDYARLALLREQALKTLGLSTIEKYLFIWVRSLFLPFGIVGSLFLADNIKKRKYWFLFWSFLIIGLFINSITLEKSPIATIFLILTVYYYIKKNKLNIRTIFIYSIIIISIPFTISYFLHYGKNGALEIVINSLMYRIFIIPSEVLYQYFYIFPDIHDFLLGRSSQIFSWFHYDGTFPLSNYVARVWWNDPTTSGSCNANYIGNFWADFGLIGVFISTFFIGLITHLFYFKLLIASEFKKNFLYVCSTAVVIPIFTFGFFSSNFTTLFLTRGLILLYFIFILFNHLNIKYNRTIK